MSASPFEVAQEWLKYAWKDLELAAFALTAVPPLTEGSLYHSQQAAEKALKAYVVFLEEPIVKTHDLAFLIEIIAKKDIQTAQALTDAADLSRYSWLYRYPGESKPPAKTEAEEALRTAERALRILSNRVQAPRTDT